jgi:hypothetical protein
VLVECEHRRRGLTEKEFAKGIAIIAREKLDEIHRAYEEFGGSATYWRALEKEILQTLVPQYEPAAESMTRLERAHYNVFRGGDLGARFLFAFIGLLIGSIIIALPFIPIFEDMFAFVTTALGFLYPDLKKFLYERSHAKLLNRLVNESARYQSDARLSYMTSDQIRDSFTIGEPKRLPGSEESDEEDDHA